MTLEWRDIRFQSQRLAAAFRARPLSMGFIAVALFAAFSIALIDRPLAIHLKTGIDHETTGFFKTITDIGKSLPYLLLSALIYLGLRTLAHMAVMTGTIERMRHYSRVAGYFFLTVASSAILVNIFKVLFGRARPKFLFESDLYGFAFFRIGYDFNSFPSGHSQTIWAVAMALYFIFPRYDYAWLAMAVLISASRVFTTVHYLSDVAMGAYIGIACAVYLKRRFAEKGTDVQIRLKRDRKLV